MKKRVINTVLILTLSYVFMLSAAGDNTRQVHVRVFSGNVQVSDVTQDDFKLYEGEQMLPVTGFKVTRRSLKPGSQTVSGPRLFLLKFHLNRFTAEVRQSAAHVFNHILREQDRVLIAAGSRTLYFENLSDKTTAFGLVESVLKEQAAWTRKQMHAEIKGMEEFIDWVRKEAKEDVHPGATYGNWHGVHPHYYMKYLKNSIERYLGMLNGFKEKFLMPDVLNYTRLLSHLEKKDTEKWLISFFQMPVWPRYNRANRQMINEWIKELSTRGWLDEQDYVRKLERLQGDIDNVLDVSSEHYDPLFAEIVQQFYKAGFVFHSIFLSPDAAADARELDRKVYVKADVEKAMKKRLSEVAWLTGGAFTSGTSLAADTPGSPLLEQEDFYYTITYTPGESAGKGLKLDLPNKSYRPVFYNGQHSKYLARRIEQAGEQAADIRIEHISFKKKTLSMTIDGFAKVNDKKTSGKKQGKLDLLVRIIDDRGNVVFNKKNVLLAHKESISLSLDFNWLKAGKYNLIADAKDLITGKAWAQVSGFKVH
jgi:hypothetical protein